MDSDRSICLVGSFCLLDGRDRSCNLTDCCLRIYKAGTYNVSTDGVLEESQNLVAEAAHHSWRKRREIVVPEVSAETLEIM